MSNLINDKNNKNENILRDKPSNKSTNLTPPNISSNINQENSDSDDFAKDTMNQLGNGLNSVRNGARHTTGNIKNAANNARKMAAKGKQNAKNAKKAAEVGAKAGKAFAKAVMAAVKALIAFLGPTVCIIILVVILLALVFTFLDNESVSGDRFIKTETVTDYNTLEYNEEGEPELTEVTMSNKFIRAFYAYFAEQSVWINSEGVVHHENGNITKDGIDTNGKPVQYKSKEYIKLYGDPDDEDSEYIGDKYKRESAFYINPDALYVLDKYLHKSDFRFPEQIVKHVAYEKNTDKNGDLKKVPYKLKQITNDEGDLTLKSTKFVKPTSKTVTDENGKIIDSTGILKKSSEKTEGVQDYGFGSILNYEKYIEANEKRGKLSTIQVWDPEKKVETTDKHGNKTIGYGGVVTVSIEEYNANQNKYQLFFNLNKEYKWEHKTNPVHMITWAVTPAGTVANKIDFEWEDTGEKHVRPEKEKVTKKVTRLVKTTETKKITILPNTSKTVDVELDKEGKVVKTETLVYDAKPTIKITEDKDENGEVKHEEVYEPQEKEYKYTYYDKIKVEETFEGKVEGTLWSIEPRYKDEVDLSAITGTRYYTDYLTYYDGYVPLSVQGKFNLEEIKERTNSKNDEDLLKILDNQRFSGDTTSADAGGFFDETGAYIGIGCIQTKYETGSGIGEANPGATGDDGAGYYSWGIPQFPEEMCAGFIKWLKEKDTAFYNQYFGGVQIVTTHGGTPFEKAWKECAEEQPELFTKYQISYAYKKDMLSALKSIERKVPIIDFERSFILQEFTYSIASHGPAVAIDVFSNAGLKATDSDEEIIKKVSKKLYNSVEKWWVSNPQVWNGIKNRWNPDRKGSQPYIMLEYLAENGERAGYEYDRETELFTGGSTSGSGGFSDNKLLAGLKKFFKNTGEYLSDLLLGKEYKSVLDDKYWTQVVGSGIKDESQRAWIMSSLFAYEDGKPVTDYVVDDDYFKIMFDQLFSNQINTEYNATGGIISKYLANNCSKPIDKFELVGKYSTENPMLKMTTKLGSEVKAIADGIVIDSGYDSDYGGYYVMIQHSKCVSIYGNIDDILVKKNKKVKMGDVIASTKSTLQFGLKTKAKGVHINPTDILESYGSGELGLPIKGMNMNDITSPFGDRIHPITGSKEFHQGVDIAFPQGTEIVATSDGTVITATYHYSYGKYVLISHGDKTQTLYAHMSELNVKSGQKVRGGQVIGEVGSTGMSTGPHLHFEVRVDGEYKDPTKFMKVPK